MAMGDAYQVWICDDCDHQLPTAQDGRMTCSTCDAVYEDSGKRIHEDPSLRSG